MASSKPKPRRSNSSSSFKQAVLPFASTKRTASATNAGTSKSTKAKQQPISIRPISSGSSGSSSPAKKQRLSPDEEDEPAVVVSESERARGGVFRSREGRENVVVAGGGSQTSPPPERVEKLVPGDKRWRKAFREARAKMGHLEPIHAQDQTHVHHILRIFDLSYEYGPCAGVSRLERWERAEALGLNPPPEVRDILLTKEGMEDTQFSQCVFYGEV